MAQYYDNQDQKVEVEDQGYYRLTQELKWV
jgi:hypothetical protein